MFRISDLVAATGRANILSGPWPVFANLNSQLFFDPNPTWPKSQTVRSKEIFGKTSTALAHAVATTKLTNGDNGWDSGSAYIFRRCPDADLSGDCSIDFSDFAQLASQWLGP